MDPESTQPESSKKIIQVDFNPHKVEGEKSPTESPHQTPIEARGARGESNPYFTPKKSNISVAGQPLSKDSPHQTAEESEAARSVVRPNPWKRN